MKHAPLAICLVLGLVSLEVARADPPPPRGRVDVKTVHSKLLERTPTGESADRRVSVYLPPSYDTSPGRRYPVVYLLHGIFDTDAVWSAQSDPWSNIKDVMDRGVAEARFGELIVVMPDERTKAGGSFYRNSTATGAWEDFTVKELVRWTDDSYRTIRRATARAIAGHSMGGYGALALAMNHPEVYAAVYAMNPATLGWARDLMGDNPVFADVVQAKSFDDLLKPSAGDPRGGYKLAVICLAQALSPNPRNPPFFVDLPFELARGALVPTPAFERWDAGLLTSAVRARRDQLAKLRGIRFDSGYEDEFLHIPPTARQLSVRLTSLAIPHVFEEYNGDHRNRLWGSEGRIATEVMPWLWRRLDHQ